MSHTRSIFIADIQILSASFFFGIGFLGQRAISVDGLGPMTCNAFRFGLSTILLAICLPMLPSDGPSEKTSDNEDDDEYDGDYNNHDDESIKTNIYGGNIGEGGGGEGYDSDGANYGDDEPFIHRNSSSASSSSSSSSPRAHVTPNKRLTHHTKQSTPSSSSSSKLHGNTTPSTSNTIKSHPSNTTSTSYILKQLFGKYAHHFKNVKKTVWFWGLALGLLNFLGSGFQQWGISMTSASKVAFIAGFDLFLTPIFGLFIPSFKLHTNVSLSTWLAVGVSLIGLFLLSGANLDDFEMGMGETLTLISTVFWTMHITYTDIATTYVDTMTMMVIQMGFVSFLSMCAALYLEPHQWFWGHRWLFTYWPWIIYLAVTEGLGFTLMATGQNTAPPTHAAIILSLEGVFAAVASYFFIGEHLSTREFIGCILMLLSTLAAEIGCPMIDNLWLKVPQEGAIIGGNGNMNNNSNNMLYDSNYIDKNLVELEAGHSGSNNNSNSNNNNTIIHDDISYNKEKKPNNNNNNLFNKNTIFLLSPVFTLWQNTNDLYIPTILNWFQKNRSKISKSLSKPSEDSSNNSSSNGSNNSSIA